MKFFNLIKRLTVFAILCSSGTVFGQPSKHVILISIDGFRPDFYLENSWPAPNLQEMMRQGSYAKGVRGIFPSVTKSK